MSKDYSTILLNIIATALDAHCVVLFAPKDTQGSSEQQEYVLTNGIAYSGELKHEAVLTERDSLLGLVLRRREPLVIKNYDFNRNKQRLVYYKEGSGTTVKSFVSLKTPRGIILCIDSERQYTFGEQELKIIHLFADLLDSMELQDSYKTQSEELSSYCKALRLLYELRKKFLRWDIFLRELLQLLVTTTKYDYAVFVVKDTSDTQYFIEGESEVLFLKNNTVEYYPIHSGAISWVFRNNAVLMVEGNDVTQSPPLFGKDFDNGFFPSFLAAPVEMEGEVRGALCFLHNTNKTVSEGLKDFITVVTDYLGMYLTIMEVKAQQR
ncbi:MAG: GAF domain-containing protein [Desulfovibrionaceae bacterium]|nr:GAF domain-containing protein [Desulfovibrionaceae bacterium]